MAEEWETIHSAEVAYKTWTTYQGHLNALIEEFEGKDIKDITHLDITLILQRMAKQRYADKTVRSRFNICNMIMQHAMYQRYITSNPCDIVKIPKGLVKTQRELPDNSEIQKVKDGLSCHFGLFAYFLLFTGLRRGEALAIEWKDIDFQRSTINVSKSIYFENNRPKLKSTKTVNGVRTIPLLAPLKKALSAFKFRNGYLFGGAEPMTEQAFRRAWEHYKKDSGVTITPHQLRHAYATILYDAEIDPKAAQKLMGHSDYKTTVEIYTHISNSREQSAVEKLNSFVANF